MTDAPGIRHEILTVPFRSRLRVTLKDGSKREGLLIFRSKKRGFCVNDSIDTISYDDVRELEVVDDA